jgi:hypothetical protein
MSIMETTQESLTKTVEGVKDSTKLEKAIDTGAGLMGYSLEAPAKQLVPFASPLRNIIPRKLSKTGTSVHWKAITDVAAAGKATAIEGVRGNGMRYSVADKLAAFKVIGLQDSVTFEAEAAGRNFQDVKATAVTNLLLRVMTEEEKIILGGNTTALPAVATPVATTATVPNSTITAGSYSVKVAALTLVAANRVVTNAQLPNLTGLEIPATDASNQPITGAYDGVTAASTAASVTVTAGDGISATVTPVKGALAYAWFVGASGSETLQIVTTNSAMTIDKLVTGGSSAPTADGSADPLAFDGIIPQIINGGGLFYDMANQQLTASAGGIEVLDEINSRLFNEFKNGATRYLVSEQLAKDITSAIVKNNGAPTLFVNNTEKNDITGNYMVRRYVNKSFGGENISIEVHPWLPNGTMVVMCDNVPYPNANIPSVLEMECGYDYRQLEYARTSPKYEFEVRTYEALKHYFPACQAIITNVKTGIA